MCMSWFEDGEVKDGANTGILDQSIDMQSTSTSVITAD